ncbi:hypothetical protein PAAG_08135 [Paracoccidioides lutzii Pb01]|uniref:Uncharacterized protein n=1 Tax=Paracoccidioides lutzii (strain ATCC MYA-826 / Pb01) TaxID=502779 RepID=C1HBJ4_PARBA|nr:hypothetical protein PAAG_08135 [Paracoccidioides lutzii Pb01]EEH38408.2 hypothetical protein PAAG_08135 [Paracoccidioides lutzii Pb01]
MDEFAQTRGVDDLFDDEIVPIPSHEVEIEYHDEQQQFELQLELQPATTPQPALDTQPLLSPDPPQPLTSQSLQRHQQQLSHQSPAPTEHQLRGGLKERSGARTSRDGSHSKNRGNKRGYGEKMRGRGRSGGGCGNGRDGIRARSQPTEEKSDFPSHAHAAAEVEAAEPVTEKDEQTEKAAAHGDADERDGCDDEDKEIKEQKIPAPASRTFAVKGDRSGTGGVKKPKLTEDELTERMKAAKIKSAERAAAHARAEADEASFLERERIAAEKRREEMQNRRAMNGERERNRQRKLDTQTRREWDSEKSAEAFAVSALMGRGRGGSGGGNFYWRDAHSGLSYDGAPPTTTDVARGHVEESFPKPAGSGYFCGRGGGRGNPRRGRGGKGRGDYFVRQLHGPCGAEAISSTPNPLPPRVSAEDEFPALPPSVGGNGKRDEDENRSGSSSGSSSGNNNGDSTPMSPLGSWAEQVEMSQAQAQSQE